MARMENVNFGSISVAESLPALIIKPKTPDDGTIIYVEGMSGPTAASANWKDIVDGLIALYNKLTGDGGGGGKCTGIKVTNPDGSTVEIKTCPPA